MSLARKPGVMGLASAIQALGGPDAPYMDEFLQLFRAHHLGKGENFAHAGEVATKVAFVLNGVARMYYCRADGKEYVKGFVHGPGFMSSMESLLTKQPSRLGIQALSPMQLLVADYSNVALFFERDIYWQRVGRHIVETLFVKKARREASLLMESATERYSGFLAEHGALAAQIPDFHIAAYLGITPEALSRLKRTLAPAG